MQVKSRFTGVQPVAEHVRGELFVPHDPLSFLNQLVLQVAAAINPEDAVKSATRASGVQERKAGSGGPSALMAVSPSRWSQHWQYLEDKVGHKARPDPLQPLPDPQNNIMQAAVLAAASQLPVHAGSPMLIEAGASTSCPYWCLSWLARRRQSMIWWG